MTNPIVPSISDEQLEALEQFCRIPAFNENANVCQNIGELRGLIARLRAAEADAKRYRWLREACDNDPDNLGVCYAETPGVDAAIDAAMERKP